MTKRVLAEFRILLGFREGSLLWTKTGSACGFEIRGLPSGTEVQRAYKSGGKVINGMTAHVVLGFRFPTARAEHGRFRHGRLLSSICSTCCPKRRPSSY